MKRLSSALMTACAAPMLCAQPTSAEVIKQGESSFVTRHAVVVKADPFETWQALITPSKWWNSNHTWSADAENLYISPQGGGCFCELLPLPKDSPDGIRRGSAQHMTVVLADPARALRMRGALGPLQSEPVDGVLTMTITPTDKGTAIVFEYVVGGYMRFETAEIARAVDGVMGQQITGLARLLGPAAEVPASPAENGADAGREQGGDEVSGPEGEADAAILPPAPKPAGKKPPSVDEAFGTISDD